MGERICIFITDLDCGGAQRVVLTLCNSFARKGYHVDLVIARGGGILESEISESVNTIILSYTKKKGPIFLYQVIGGFRSYLKSHQPKAILSSITGANLVACLVRDISVSNIKLVLRHENTGPNYKGFIQSGLVKLFYPKADNIITISQGAASDLVKILRKSKKSVHVINNPINVDNIRIKSGETVNHPWLANKSCPVILAVGRLFPQKDYETLLHAFAMMQSIIKCRLIILGEGPERKKLDELIITLGIDNIVSMPGVVQNPYPMMRSADVYTLTSKWEGLPVALIEAMSLGCKIVATDCHSGPRELLENGKYGTLVPVADRKKLCNALAASIESPCDRKSLIDATTKNYDVDPIANSHLELLIHTL